MQQQLVPLAQRCGEFAGPGGPAHGHDHGGDAGWWVVSIIIIVLLATIAGLLVWLGRRVLAAADGPAAPAVTATPVQPPVAAAPGTPAAPAVDPDAPTEVQDKA